MFQLIVADKLIRILNNKPSGILLISEAHYGCCNLTVAQYLAAQVPFDPADVVTIVDSGVAIAALSPTQIAQLGANNVDALDADDNLLTLDTAQLDALGTVTRLTDTDLVTLSDFSAVLDGGSPAVIATLDGLGVDVIDATDGHLTYSLEMFDALGHRRIGGRRCYDRIPDGGELDDPDTPISRFTAKASTS